MRKVFISQDTKQENLPDGTFNVKYAVHVQSSGINYQEHDKKTFLNVQLSVKSVLSDESTNIKRNNIINYDENTVSVKHNGLGRNIDLSTIPVAELDPKSFKNSAEYVLALENYFLETFLANNNVYGVKKWVELK